MRLTTRLTVVSALLIAAIGSQSPAVAATFNVADVAGLRAALLTAATNGEDDVIVLAAGTYATGGTTFTFLPNESNTLTLQGASGTARSQVVLDGGGITSVLNFYCFTSCGSITLQGLVVQNGKATGSALKPYGGGVNSLPFLIVSDVSFSGNTATFDGGAIYGTSGVTVTNCNFSNNTAGEVGTYGSGGAIYGNYGVSVTTSTFSNNTATLGSGGAIYGNYGVSVTNSTFSNNTATVASGGVIYANGSDMTVANSTFKNNTAGFNGGAMYGNYGVSVTNSTFSNNTVTGNGGAIHGTVISANSTFSGNSVGGLGAAIYSLSQGTINSDPQSIINSLFYGHTKGAIYVGSAYNLYNNLIDTSTDIAGSSPKMSGNVVPGATSPFVDAANGNFRLDAGSLAINAGLDPNSTTFANLVGSRNVAALRAALLTDLDGNPRPKPGTAVDIGAYEYGSTAPPVYNIPSPTNVDQPFLRFYNPSATTGAVRGTLYDQTGAVLGTPNNILIASAAAKSVTVLAARDIATAFGVADWTGRAWMSVQADFSGLQILNLIRSSLLINMSCLNSQYALYLPNPSSSEQSYVRVYNPSSTAGAVRGTMYDEGGNVVGTPNAVLIASLAANAVQVLASTDIANAFQISTWAGKAWMSLTSDFAGLKIMTTLRDTTTNTLINASCDTGSTGTSANIYNIPPTTSSTTASVRIYNTSSSASTVTGTLYSEAGSVLGLANAQLGIIPANGVLTLSQSNIASLVGASTWTGRAWMQVNSSVTGLKVLAFTKQAMNMDMSCVNTGNIAFNIPDATNTQDQPNIRIYNTSSTAGSVFGTLYDGSGNVVGTANSLLVSNMPSKSVVTFTASTLASAVGSSGWTARAWLQLSSTLSGLQVMNILQDVASGTWSNISCATN